MASPIRDSQDLRRKISGGLLMALTGEEETTRPGSGVEWTAYGPEPARRQLGDDVVNAVPDQPEAQDQGHDDDDLVGMGIDPVPQPGQERLRRLGAEPGVDLHGQERGCGDDAEQRQGKVTLPGGELRPDDDGDTGG